MALTRWSQGSVHPGDRRLRHGTAHDQASGLPIPAVRCGGQEAGARHAASCGPRQPILRPYVQEFAEPLRDARLDERQSNCYDNAPMESFLGTLKTEHVFHRQYETRQQAMREITEYIELFYNRQRRQKQLGYLAPAVFERQFYDLQLAA